MDNLKKNLEEKTLVDRDEIDQEVLVNNKISKQKHVTKLVFLIPILVAIIIFVLFAMLKDEIDRMLLNEKRIEKRFEIDLIAEQTDNHIAKSGNWVASYDGYLDTIVNSLEMIDSTHMTYAVLFDNNLENLSVRSPSYEGSPFEPNKSVEFVKAVNSNESGELELSFTPQGEKERTMYVYYRWVPSDKTLENRFLAVVAISKYSVDSTISRWVQITSIILIIVAFLVSILLWRRHVIKSMNNMLEGVVQQRTKELEEQKEDARNSSMAKSDFLARMSHEFRTPLNIIVGLSHIIRDSSEKDSKSYNAIIEVNRAAMHLNRILNDVLNMTKIEKGTLELTIAPFSFSDAMKEVVDSSNNNSKEKKITLVHNTAEIPSMIIDGDRLYLVQILLNLLNNAVKFSNIGGNIYLYVFPNEDKENQTVEIKFQVKDDGIGISEDQVDKIYQAFEQANSSISTNFGGVGLGLPITQELVSLMGGSIDLESEIDKGSTFEFTLTFPIASEMIEDDEIPTMNLDLSGKRVLIAEDVEINRIILIELLSDSNAEVEESENGQFAFDMFEKSEEGYYDIILMDIQMPVLDGYEATRKIRALDRPDAKSIPIIAVSANSYQDDIEKGVQAGMNRHVSKPVDFNELLYTIDEVLN